MMQRRVKGITLLVLLLASLLTSSLGSYLWSKSEVQNMSLMLQTLEDVSEHDGTTSEEEDEFIVIEDEDEKKARLREAHASGILAPPDVLKVSLSEKTSSSGGKFDGSMSHSMDLNRSGEVNFGIAGSGGISLQGGVSGSAGRGAPIFRNPSGPNSGSFRIFGNSEVIEDYRSTESNGSTTPRLHQSDHLSGTGSRSGSGIFSGSRSSRLGESPKSLSSSGYQMKRTFAPGRTEISDLLATNGLYVDKSRWIHHFLSQSTRVAVILRPSKFGKTMAINSGRHYLDAFNKNGKTWELQMNKNHYKQEQANKFAVIVIEFKKAAGLMQASSANEFVAALTRYLGKLIFDTMKKFRKDESNIPFHLKETYQLLCGPFPTADLNEWANSLSFLIQITSHFSFTQVALFVDDYDAVLFKAYHVNAFDDLSTFFQLFYYRAFELNEKFLFKAAVFGVHRFHDCFPFKNVPKMRYYGMGDEPYHLEFAFNSITDLVNIQNNYNSVIMSKDIIEMYGGYAGGTLQNNQILMGPAGIVKVFKCNRLDISFPFQHLRLDLEALPFANLYKFGVGDLYKILSKGEPFKETLPSHIDLSSAAAPSNYNTLLTFLKLEGLLSYNLQAKEMIPVNPAAREYLFNFIDEWFNQRYRSTKTWLTLSDLDISDFKARTSRAWNLKSFFGGNSPCFSQETGLFFELLMRSVDKCGNPIPEFQKKFISGIEKLKFPEDVSVDVMKTFHDLKLIRFRTPDGKHLLVVLGWTPHQGPIDLYIRLIMLNAKNFYTHLSNKNDKKDSTKGGRNSSIDHMILASRKGPTNTQFESTYPDIDHMIGVIFCKHKAEPVYYSTIQEISTVS